MSPGNQGVFQLTIVQDIATSTSGILIEDAGPVFKCGNIKIIYAQEYVVPRV